MAIHYGPLKTVEGLNKMPTLQNVLERDESIELDIELGLWKKQQKKSITATLTNNFLDLSET